jgi:hypothetical protein
MRRTIASILVSLAVSLSATAADKSEGDGPWKVETRTVDARGLLHDR